KHQRRDPRLPWIQRRVDGENLEHVRVRLEREDAAARTDRERDRQRGVAGVRADVDGDVAVAQKRSQRIDARLRDGFDGLARMTPAGELDVAVLRQVDGRDVVPVLARTPAKSQRGSHIAQLHPLYRTR